MENRKIETKIMAHSGAFAARGCARALAGGRLRWILAAFLVMVGLLPAADPGASGGAQGPQPTALLPRIRVLDLGWDTRFNYMDREGGPVTDRSVQYRLRTRVRADLSRSGTWLELRAETGKGFDNSWNNTGAGLGRGQEIFNVKSIALHQQFGERFEVAAGGLDFEHGAGTDATYASGDGHMTGYRASFLGHGAGLPQKLSVTAGYVGDFDRPNFFSRLHMDRVNYVQLLAEQSFGEQLRASAEVDSIRHAGFGRTAARYGRLWIFEDATVEAAIRASDAFRFSWASSVSRHWGKASHWRSDLIYSDLPYGFYLVNGQRVLLNRGELDIGKRLSAGTAYRIGHECEVGVFGGRLLDQTPSKRWVAQAGISYQFAGLLNRLMR
jgi:hypothetical protein